MSDVSLLSGISGVSFDSTLLSPVLFFYLLLLLFSSCPFFLLTAHTLDFFPKKFFNIFRWGIGSFVWLAKQQREVCWSVLWAACCHSALISAVMHLCFFVCFCPFLFNFFFNRVLVNWMAGSMVLRCCSLRCFFNRSNIRGIISLKMLCLMFVHVCFVSYLCQD